MDIETGKLIQNEYKRIKSFIKDNKTMIKVFLLASLVFFLAFMFETTRNNLDHVVHKNSGFTINEEPYHPISLSETIVFHRSHGNYKKVINYNSIVNQKLQLANFNKIHEKVASELKKNEWECIHLRYYDIEYDIVTFANFTLIEPTIVKTNGRWTHIEEIDLNGDKSFQKRPVGLTIKALSHTNMSMIELELENDMAICFSHYYNLSI